MNMKFQKIANTVVMKVSVFCALFFLMIFIIQVFILPTGVASACMVTWKFAMLCLNVYNYFECVRFETILNQ